jgi:mRNA-degrading endonuclease RelE of RelBE toxin-antitoxin system
MGWTVNITKKARKSAAKMTEKLQSKLDALVAEIQVLGPVRGNWPNYSKLADGSHHCHLDYSHVACWSETDKKIQIVEVYYAGSRKNAPYD